MHFFSHIGNLNLVYSGRMSRSRLKAQRGAVCTPWCKFGPRPGSVARALGVQSRGELAVFAGSFSADPEPIEPMETNPQTLFFFVLCCCVLLTVSVQQPYQPSNAVCFDAATVQQQPRFNFPPFCDSNKRCFCLCVRARGVTRSFTTRVPGGLLGRVLPATGSSTRVPGYPFGNVSPWSAHLIITPRNPSNTQQTIQRNTRTIPTSYYACSYDGHP